MKASLLKSLGLPRVDKLRCQNQSQSVQQVKPLCTLPMRNGSTLTEICHCALINGPMWSDGSLSTLPHSLERESSCGRKDTQHMLLRMMQMNLSLKSLRSMQKRTKSYWLSLLYEDASLKMKGSLVLITLLQLNFTSLSVEEESKVLRHTCLAKISLRCSR